MINYMFRLFTYHILCVSDENGIEPNENNIETSGGDASATAGIDSSESSSETTTHNTRLLGLQKEYAKELKVKEGLERFLAMGHNRSKMIDDSRSMLYDIKAKIALLRMQIEKIQRQEQVAAANGQIGNL